MDFIYYLFNLEQIETRFLFVLFVSTFSKFPIILNNTPFIFAYLAYIFKNMKIKNIIKPNRLKKFS